MPKNLSAHFDSRQSGLFDSELIRGFLKVRRSNRAKYLRINTHLQYGVEVVVPQKMNIKYVAPFIQQHQEWINQQIEKYNKHQAQPLPKQIQLKALGQSWQVEYKFDGVRHFRTQESESILHINGDKEDKSICKRKLNKWLRTKAKIILPNWLNNISLKIGLPHQRIFVRSQRTCWGSCSKSNNINLNDRLLFLAPDIVEYVMIHELCHTQHMNHSRHFWNLVNKHCPRYPTLEKQLTNSQNTIPNWA